MAKATPIYLLCERNPPLSMVKHVIECSPLPSDEVIADCLIPGGQLPLHAACTWGASYDVIQAIIQKYTDGVAICDEMGNLPMHCACFAGASNDILELLFRSYPKAVLSRNVQGRRPLCIVKRLRYPNRNVTIQYLKVNVQRLEAIEKILSTENCSGFWESVLRFHRELIPGITTENSGTSTNLKKNIECRELFQILGISTQIS